MSRAEHMYEGGVLVGGTLVGGRKKAKKTKKEKKKRHCVKEEVGPSGKLRCHKYSKGGMQGSAFAGAGCMSCGAGCMNCGMPMHMMGQGAYSGGTYAGGAYNDVPRKYVGRSQAQVKAAAASPWIRHVKRYRAAHPGMSYKEALVEASASY